MTTNEYFFELLVEEIPAWMLEPKLAQLRESLPKLASEFCGGAFDGRIDVGATPRRLYFRIAGLPDKQPDRTEEVKGPPLRAAFQNDQPTAALNGFLKKNNADTDAITKRDDYVWLNRSVAGQRVEDLLTAEVPRMIETLRWPKMMRWGAGEHSFIRPIHSVVSVLNGKALPITVFGVASSNTTEGHRILAKRSVKVKSFDDYIASMRDANVVVDASERVDVMRARARELAREVGGVPAADETIWDQWKYLTEAPNLVRAEFEPRFLSLPDEVLTTVMRVHQKQLPVRKDDKLTSSFLAVIDQTGDPDGNARSGNAFVTNARFADAEFFYQTDRKRSLESRLPDLEHLQFQEKLGNYRQKSDRIVRLAEIVRSRAAAHVDSNEVRNAAQLSKTDLVTEMVKEFTDLQGKVGGIYAREEGQPERVWQAIYDHYLPVSIEGAFPRSEVGAIVSIADKLDTLAGFFSIGLKPTGSKDPFALRRAAQGAVQLLLNRAGWSLELDVAELVAAALEPFNASDSVREELLAFMADRVATLLESAPFSFAYDEIAAVMASGWSESLRDALDRATAVREVRNEANFLSILDSAKRIANITAGAPSIGVRADLLREPMEKRLASLVELTAEQIEELIAARDYTAALQSFAAMAPELEQFFQDVLVMVEDLDVRQNRISLLSKCGGVVNRIADVTKIVVDRRDYQKNA